MDQQFVAEWVVSQLFKIKQKIQSGYFFPRDVKIWVYFITWCWATFDERISCLSSRTTANRVVINHTTLSALATNSRTRIFTFLVDASQGGFTVRVQKTFRSTTGWHAKVISLTGTYRSTIHFATDTVWTARRWVARCTLLSDCRLGWPWYCKKLVFVLFCRWKFEVKFVLRTFNRNNLAGFKWTASIALRTVTSGKMVDNSTFCVVAT